MFLLNVMCHSVINILNLGEGFFVGGGGWAGEELGMGVSRLAFVVNAHVGF